MRLAVAALLLVFAVPSAAQSVLLPVLESVAPFHLEYRCAGLQVYDVGLRRLVRHHRGLDCPRAIVATGPGRAIALSHPVSNEPVAVPLEIQSLDFDHGAALSRHALGTLPYGDEATLRLVGTHDVLVAIGGVTGAGGSRRLVRLRLDGVQWRTLYDVTATGDYTLVSEGDRIALVTRIASGASVAIRNVADLGLVRELTIALPTPAHGVLAAHVAGSRLHLFVFVPDARVQLWTYDVVSGTAIAARDWPAYVPHRLSFDPESRVLVQRGTSLGSGRARTEIVAISLDDLSVRTLGVHEGEYLYGEPVAFGADAYMIDQEPILCFTGLCGAPLPIEIRRASGGALDVFAGDAFLSGRDSVQFIGAPLGGGDAQAVPALSRGGTALLAAALALLAFAGRRTTARIARSA